MIPRILHYTWIAPPERKIPERFEAYITHWRELLPGWDFRPVTLENCPRSPFVEKALAAGKYVLASNYARFQRLFCHGGVFLDIDVELLKPLDPFLDNPAFCGVMGTDGQMWMGNAVLGAEAGHPLFGAACEFMDAWQDLSKHQVENETGPRMITRLARDQGWNLQDATARLPGLTIYDSKYFYPYLYTESYTPACLTERTVAIHQWASTWRSVSIVIPCYNYARYLPDAIDSALAQTYRALEVIVVDDGSTDETPSVVARYGDRIRYIRRENGGLAAARNTGIRAATGQWILPLDADDVLDPKAVERMMLRSADDTIVACWTQEFDEARRLQKPVESALTRQNFLCRNWISCTSLYARQQWELAGGYDEAPELRRGYEDWDFWIRLVHAGCRVTIVPEPLFFYRQHAGSMLRAIGPRHGETLRYLAAKHEALGLPAGGMLATCR